MFVIFMHCWAFLTEHLTLARNKRAHSKQGRFSLQGRRSQFSTWGGGGGDLAPGGVGGSGAILPQKVLKSKCRPRKK